MHALRLSTAPFLSTHLSAAISVRFIFFPRFIFTFISLQLATGYPWQSSHIYFYIWMGGRVSRQALLSLPRTTETPAWGAASRRRPHRWRASPPPPTVLTPCALHSPSCGLRHRSPLLLFPAADIHYLTVGRVARSFALKITQTNSSRPQRPVATIIWRCSTPCSMRPTTLLLPPPPPPPPRCLRAWFRRAAPYGASVLPPSHRVAVSARALSLACAC